MLPTRLLDPAGLTLVSRMELIARRAVEGFLSGLHPSPYFGSSVEYADHRPYCLGDEIRTIDWKLLAKTDKYYVKLFEEQTNTRCSILLDVSRSMAFQGEGAAVSKLEHAMFMAAALGYLMLRQNDAVGLATFDRQVRTYLPPRATARHLRQMLQIMHETQQAPRGAGGDGGDTRIGPVLHDLAGKLPRRGIIVLISDLLDDPATIISGLSHFKHQRNEVIVFHLIDPVERTFPFEKLTRFKDMEGGGQIIAHPGSIRRAYLQRLTEFLDKMRRMCLERDIGYELVSSDRKYDQTLSAYLARRARVR